MADVITVPEALEWVGRSMADPVDESAMSLVVAAVNANIAKVYPAACVAPIEADAKLAGLLQASRWYSRRNSPDGLVGFGDMGGTSIRNLDPDIRDSLKPYRSRRVG
jgi:hypothetical protein